MAHTVLPLFALPGHQVYRRAEQTVRRSTFLSPTLMCHHLLQSTPLVMATAKALLTTATGSVAAMPWPRFRILRNRLQRLDLAFPPECDRNQTPKRLGRSSCNARNRMAASDWPDSMGQVCRNWDTPLRAVCFPPPTCHSDVAERNIKRNIRLEGAAAFCALRINKSDIQGVFIGAHFGHARVIGMHRDA